MTTTMIAPRAVPRAAVADATTRAASWVTTISAAAAATPRALRATMTTTAIAPRAVPRAEADAAGSATPKVIPVQRRKAGRAARVDRRGRVHRAMTTRIPVPRVALRAA